MADEPEQKLEASKIKKTSDATAEAGVISGQANQNQHEKAFEIAHAADRTPSGIMPAIHESFGIEGALTAADMGAKPSKAQTTPDAIVAWDPREQLKEWGKGLGKTTRQVKQAGAEVSAELTKDGSMLDKPSHPYKDNPDQLMDYNACHKAWKHFPVFARHPNLDAALLPAMLRNEVRSLRVDDKYLWNPSAEHGWGLEKDRTIGPANMKTEHIDRLVKRYPQLVNPELGGIDPVHRYRDAIKPEKAAWLAAAYLANEAEKMEATGHKKITHRDLVESYNPKADLDSQLKRIHEQLIHVKRNHPLFRDE
jgi:hypothetical protein